MGSKEITIGEILLKIRPVLFIIKKNIVLLFLISLGFAVTGVLRRAPAVYDSQSKLLLKSGKSGGGGLLSLASAYGFGGSAVLSFDKFKGVAYSESIIKSVLRTKATIGGEERLIADHLAKELGFVKTWEKNKPNFLSANLSLQGRNQDSIFKILIPKAMGMIKVGETKEELISVVVVSGNEELAVVLNNALIDEVVHFFGSITIATDIKTKDLLEVRIDSLKSQLFSVEQRMAELKDHSFQTVKTKGLIDILRVERNLRILNEMYIEATKQHELVNFKILNNSAGLDIIDRPYMPLDLSRVSFVKAGFTWGFTGGILGLLLFLLKDFRRDIQGYFKENKLEESE